MGICSPRAEVLRDRGQRRRRQACARLLADALPGDTDSDAGVGDDGEDDPKLNARGGVEAPEGADRGPDRPAVYGDAVYGAGKFLARLETAGAQIFTKVRPPAAPGGRFAKDRFTIDPDAGTITCPTAVHRSKAVRNVRPIHRMHNRFHVGDALDSVPVPIGPVEAERGTPVVQHQHHTVTEVEGIPQREQVVTLLGVVVAIGTRRAQFLRGAHPDQIAGHQPAEALQVRHHIIRTSKFMAGTISRGEIDPSIDSQVLVNRLTAMIIGTDLLWLVDRDGVDLAEESEVIARGFVDLVRGGQPSSQN